MNKDYINKAENLKKDFEQFAQQDITVKIELEDKNKNPVSCSVNSKQIIVEIEDKELQKVINETIKLAGLEYTKRRQSGLSSLRKRAAEITQPLKEMAEGLGGI